MVDDGLFKRIPVPDVALAQHLLPGIAGTVRTRSGPFMSAADSLKVTVYGRGGHGASPQNTVDPVVLAAMIIVRLQAVVSRNVAPGDIAVVTVGSCQAGTRSNVIPDFAVLELNVRSYTSATRQRMLDAIGRIVRAECQASGSPKDPEFETTFSFPVTDNDAAATGRVARAFAAHFGDKADEIPRQTASEDFSKIPDAAGVPYTYWGLGYTDRDTYLAAEKDGHLDDLTSNHSPKFLPRCSPACEPAPKPWSPPPWPGSRPDPDRRLAMRVRKHPLTPLAAVAADLLARRVHRKLVTGRFDAAVPLMRVTGQVRYRPEAGGRDRRRAGAEAGVEYLEGPGVHDDGQVTASRRGCSRRPGRCRCGEVPPHRDHVYQDASSAGDDVAGRG